MTTNHNFSFVSLLLFLALGEIVILAVVVMHVIVVFWGFGEIRGEQSFLRQLSFFNSTYRLTRYSVLGHVLLGLFRNRNNWNDQNNSSYSGLS